MSRFGLVLAALTATAIVLGAITMFGGAAAPAGSSGAERTEPPPEHLPAGCAARRPVDASGFATILTWLPKWGSGESLTDVRASWDNVGRRLVEFLALDKLPPGTPRESKEWVEQQLKKTSLLHYEGDVAAADATLAELRTLVLSDERLATDWLATIAYFQGVTAMRRAENDNCVDCTGPSACIVPIANEAVHSNRAGSRTAIRRFTEVLERFPDDLEVRWLLNLAHMTLGEWPAGVNPSYKLPLETFFASRPGMPAFTDVAKEAGIARHNMAGGAILEDFDGDGLLDVAYSCVDPLETLAFYRSRGDGTFEDVTKRAGTGDQLGGLNCVQTDYDNDGRPDVWVVRGAWFPYPIRQSLLKNRGDGTFEDVTKAAGLEGPVNSNGASWGDFDNDGFLDVFVACELQPNKLYRNRGDGTFENVAARAGVEGGGPTCKGAAWIDYDNDAWPDLFVSSLEGTTRLWHNERDGTFRDVTAGMGIVGPKSSGFSCWTFDFDDDGWLDLFATSYARTTADVVRGLIGEPHTLAPSHLYRNLGGKGFRDVAKDAGLDAVYATMGSNFADFDGDGRLDVYLATGDPNLGMLVPNRMFRNVDGVHFDDVTSASRTGHLQKGHAIACGDYDRDGDVDLLAELGGAVPGDRFHDALFKNPGNANRSVTVKLVGTRTNRAAIGARLKLVTAGKEPRTLHRLISTGSSFGANPLEQTIGLGSATEVATLEVFWPTSGTTQTFHAIPAGRRVVVTEGDSAPVITQLAPGR